MTKQNRECSNCNKSKNPSKTSLIINVPLSHPFTFSYMNSELLNLEMNYTFPRRFLYPRENLALFSVPIVENSYDFLWFKHIKVMFYWKTDMLTALLQNYILLCDIKYMPTIIFLHFCKTLGKHFNIYGSKFASALNNTTQKMMLFFERFL